MRIIIEEFINDYYPAISEKIETQQNKYSLARIHSHRHISRCIIYADWYADIMNIAKEDVQRYKLFFAIAFHDIGRRGELEDVWMGLSYEIYVNYIFNEIKVDKKIVNNNEEMLINKYEKSILNDIIHDVDCLDIMRSGTGRGGIMGFQKSYLNLFKENTFLQDRMVSSAWQLINLTDGVEYENEDCLKTIYERNKNEWKISI